MKMLKCDTQFKVYGQTDPNKPMYLIVNNEASKEKAKELTDAFLRDNPKGRCQFQCHITKMTAMDYTLRLEGQEPKDEDYDKIHL